MDDPDGIRALREYYASYVAGIFRTLRFGTGEAHGRAEMMEFNYLLENRALSHSGGLYTIDYARMPGVLAQLAKNDKKPADLKSALAGTKDIPVDLEPLFSFKDDVR